MNALLTGLTVLSGVCWTATYGVIIYRGWRDRSAGMPLLALGLNFGWELTYSLIHPASGVQLYVNCVWLVFDVFIVALMFRYGRRSLRYDLPAFDERFFSVLVAGALLGGVAWRGLLPRRQLLHRVDRQRLPTCRTEPGSPVRAALRAGGRAALWSGGRADRVQCVSRRSCRRSPRASRSG